MIRSADTVPLGRTGLRVSRLGLGMRPLGLLGPGHESTGRAIIETATRLGINYLDTAPTYGDGESERRLGEVSSKLPSSVVVSTKVGKVLVPAGSRRPVGRLVADAILGGPAVALRMARKAGGMALDAAAGAPRSPSTTLAAHTDYSYDGTMRSIEASLARTGLDGLDIVLIHDPDDHLDAAMAGAYRALERLRADRTISAVGVGINHWQPLMRLAEEGDFDCFLLAGRYSLLDQSALEALLPMAQARGIAMIIAGVFNSGLLADPLHTTTFDYRPAGPERIAQARRVNEVCRRHGVDIKAAAIQFPLGHPAVTSVLVGVASVAELEEDERMARAPVPVALWHELRQEGLLADMAPVPETGEASAGHP